MIKRKHEYQYLIDKAFSFLQVLSCLAVQRDCLPVLSTFKPKITFHERASLRLELSTELGTTVCNLAIIKGYRRQRERI